MKTEKKPENEKSNENIAEDYSSGYEEPGLDDADEIEEEPDDRYINEPDVHETGVQEPSSQDFIGYEIDADEPERTLI